MEAQPTLWQSTFRSPERLGHEGCMGNPHAWATGCQVSLPMRRSIVARPMRVKGQTILPLLLVPLVAISRSMDTTVGRITASAAGVFSARPSGSFHTSKSAISGSLTVSP